MNRRDVLKGLATIPVLGAVAYGVIKKERYSRLLKQNVQDAVDLSSQAPVMYTSAQKRLPRSRIGVIGYGGRGEYLLRGAGFAHPDIIDEWKNQPRQNRDDKRYDDFLAQDDLNLVLNGVCDLFDVRAERAMAASANTGREGSDGKFGTKGKKVYALQRSPRC